MYCSGCGQELAPGQTFCSQCGRASAPPLPPIPGLEFQLQNYASKVRALSVCWFIYAALSLLLGFAGLTFARAFFSGAFPWMHRPMQSIPYWPAILHFAWTMLVVRTVLAFVAGWGLIHHARWGRILAIIVAILSLIRFPIGTAMGIWTLVVLLGYRNATLYDQL